MAPKKLAPTSKSKKREPPRPPRNFFADVPGNVISYIAKGLPTVLDLINFEGTCSQIRDCVRSSVAQVWKERLQVECLANKLFSPSFDDLNTPLAFKLACRRSLDVASMYNIDSLTAPSGQTPNLVSTSMMLKLGESGVGDDMKAFMKSKQIQYKPDGGILGAQVVPGGRFLVVLQEGFITMWDLKDCDVFDQATRPTLCLVHPVHKRSMKIVYLTADGGRSLQILLLVMKPGPKDEDSKRKGCVKTSKTVKDNKNTFYAMEIRKEESKSKTFVAQGSHITLDFPNDFDREDVRPRGFVGDKMLWATRKLEFNKEKEANVANATLVLWDYKNKSIVVWKAGPVTDEPTEYLICDDHFAWATSKWMTAMKLPTHTPVPSDGKVSVFQKLAVKPTLRMFPRTPAELAKLALKPSVKHFNFVRRVESDDSSDEDICFKKYLVAFDTDRLSASKFCVTDTLSYAEAPNPETEEPEKPKDSKSSKPSNSSKSSTPSTTSKPFKDLKFLGSPDLAARLRSSDGGQIFATTFTRKAPNDRANVEGFVSLRRWTQGNGTVEDIYTDTHPLEPEVAARYLRLASSDVDAGKKLWDLSFCPASGKAVTVWRYPGENAGSDDVTKLKLHVI